MVFLFHLLKISFVLMYLKVAKLSYIIQGDFFNCQISYSIGMLSYAESAARKKHGRYRHHQ